MRLNPDCIRDILLAVENETSFSSGMRYSEEIKIGEFTNYSDDEIKYHIKQCQLSGLLTEVSWFMGGECYIDDLSPKGHEFLSNIRSDNVWRKTKETAKNVGSFSLNTLTQIAIGVVSSLINENI